MLFSKSEKTGEYYDPQQVLLAFFCTDIHHDLMSNVEFITIKEGIFYLHNLYLTRFACKQMERGPVFFPDSIEYGFESREYQFSERLITDAILAKKLALHKNEFHPQTSLVKTKDFFRFIYEHPLKPKIHPKLYSLIHEKQLKEPKEEKDSQSTVLRMIANEALDRNPFLEAKEFVNSKGAAVVMKLWGIKQTTLEDVLRETKRARGLSLKNGRPKKC